MIRTHRPRGYAWNCPSEFQQTQLFRDISYDEAEHIAAEEEYLQPDDSDDYRLPERDGKRRRIEKLADDFLNGFPLDIHSATLDPHAVNDALIYSCFDRPRDAHVAFQDIEFKRPGQQDNLWEDLEDDREVLRNFIKSNRSLAQQGQLPPPSDSQPVIIEVQAQASCGPRTRLRSAKLTVGPSEDALRRAAQLRNRRLQRPIVDVIESQPQSCPRPVIPETQNPPSFEETLEETASDCGPSPTPAWTSSKWLKSGAFELRRKDVDEDCSKDELGATSMFTPSQRTRNASRPLARTRSETSAPSNPTFTAAPLPPTSTCETTSSNTVVSNTQRHDEQTQSDYQSTDSQAFHDEDEHHPTVVTTDRLSAERGLDGEPDENSQERLLRQKGIQVRPRRSWATGNAAVEHPMQLEQASAADAATMSEAIKDSVSALQPETSQNSSRPRKAKSTGTTPTQSNKEKASRRRTAPIEPERAGTDSSNKPTRESGRLELFSKEYTAVNNLNGSPFMFRKRASKGRGDEATEAKPEPQQPQLKTRRRTVFPSSDSPQMPRSEQGTEQEEAPVEASVASPQTPLVDEHLNTILPRDAIPGRRSSSVRKLLRDELRASDALLSRSVGDSESSQNFQRNEAATHVERNPADDKLEADENLPEPAPPIESQAQPWPGTQAMLNQAQRDLFTSPDKTDTALYLGDKSTPGARPSSDPGRTTRKPLRQLSQEQLPMPSTQALLDDWKGWSSVKKPLSDVQRLSVVQSPSLGKGISKSFGSDPAQDFESARGRSSLRFSMSFNDTPDQTPSKDASHGSMPANSSHTKQKSSSSGFLKPALKRASGGTSSSLSFGVSSADLPEQENNPKESTSDVPRLRPNFQALNETNAEDPAPSLSFGASPLPAKKQPSALHDDHKDEPDSSTHIGTAYTTADPMASLQNAQNPNAFIPFGAEDSQDLYASVTELADDVLGTARETGISF